MIGCRYIKLNMIGYRYIKLNLISSSILLNNQFTKFQFQFHKINLTKTHLESFAKS